MAVKKIVFSNLSASLPNLSLGGIRFYDSNGNIINSGNLISTNNLIGVMENLTVRISHTTYDSAYYAPSNAVDTNRKQQGTWSEGPDDCAYWLSTTLSNVEYEVEFNSNDLVVSKIEFICLPDINYTNRGVTSDFIITVYNENGDEIKSYDIKPLTTIATIQTLETPELIIINKMLLKSNNKIYSLKSSENIIQLPSISKQNFINYGANLVEDFNVIKINKNYILSPNEGNTGGVWVQEINRKPLSIKFE